jgi:hypothetical protein
VFDTHPCDADRIRAADRAAETGIFEGGDEPASCLFTDFEAIGAAATLHQYEHVLKLPISEATLIDTASIWAATDQRNENRRAASVFFNDGLSVLRPIGVTVPPAGNTDNPLTAWTQARATMENMRATISAQYRLYESLQRTRDLTATALALIESGYPKVVPEQFELTDATAAEAEGTLARAIAQQAEIEPVLSRFEACAAVRLGYTLAVTDLMRANMEHVPDLTQYNGRELHAEIAILVRPLTALAAVWPDLIEMHHIAIVMGTTAAATTAYNENPQARLVTLGRLEAKLNKHWRSVRTGLDGVSAGDSSARTLNDMVGTDTDACADPTRVIAVLERALTHRWDMTTRLAAIALELEEINPERYLAAFAPVAAREATVS